MEVKQEAFVQWELFPIDDDGALELAADNTLPVNYATPSKADTGACLGE